ncbi:MAG TPA: DUF3108 domain-containing protein [Ramlibacter sp.]|jgi:hypothetical protein|uniref:DUF3108 domain-containing protein n=1 Tax=Ramlibacter sp. TaxID=1917967 RepID=UPI002D5BD650|nr:DUF3108 domain-containing protein [Ramlibacter sp.]HZY19817.1 DUF3108 domain-containing protein [Ramlibacter sp.]
MARGERLSARPRRVLLAVVAAVLAGHVAVLHWASGLQLQPGVLQPMAAPLYTRLLTPQAPAPVAAAAAAPAAPARRPTARLQPGALPPAPAASAPADAAAAPSPAAAQARPEPAPEPESPPEPAADQVAQAPEGAASAPRDPASAAAANAAAPVQPAASAPVVAASAPASGSTTTADSWPADTRLRYRLGGHFRGGDLYGNARVLWQRQETRYQVRVEVDVTFLASLVMTSQGEVGGDMLVPLAYEEIRNGRPRGLRMGESEVMLANGNVLRRPPGLQDTASQFVELSHRFATGRARLEVGRSVSFWMARPGAVDLWTYDIVRREVLRTALGEIEAFHLKPRPIANPRGNITAEMWFAPSLQHLPVRIRVNMGEEAAIDLLVEAIDQR